MGEAEQDFKECVDQIRFELQGEENGTVPRKNGTGAGRSKGGLVRRSPPDEGGLINLISADDIKNGTVGCKNGTVAFRRGEGRDGAEAHRGDIKNGTGSCKNGTGAGTRQRRILSTEGKGEGGLA